MPMTTRTQAGKLERKSYSNTTRPYVKREPSGPKVTPKPTLNMTCDEGCLKRKNIEITHSLGRRYVPDSMDTIEWSDSDDDERVYGQCHTQEEISANKRTTSLVRCKTI